MRSTTGGTHLDLLDIAFAMGTTKATFAGTAGGGTLTVTDGAHTAEVKLKGNYLTSTFMVATDHHGGTLVSDPVTTGASVPAFAHAMAGMTAAVAVPAVTAASAGGDRLQVLLARPTG